MTASKYNVTYKKTFKLPHGALKGKRSINMRFEVNLCFLSK